MRKLIALFLVLVMVAGIAGCATVTDIAGNVADKAAQELEKQLKETLEKYKVEAVETKTAFGKLNGDNNFALQFFAAVLVKAESDAVVKGCVTALNAVFKEAGFMVQTGPQVEHTYLVHKSIQYDLTDFSDGPYYTVYVYTEVSAPKE